MKKTVKTGTSALEEIGAGKIKVEEPKPHQILFKSQSLGPLEFLFYNLSILLIRERGK